MAFLPDFELTAEEKQRARQDHSIREFERIQEDGIEIIGVASINSLPSSGDEDVIYKTLDTMDLYKWCGNGYVTHNPYLVEKSKYFLIDDSVHLPYVNHVDRDLKNIRLGLLFNIHALRADINLIKQHNIDMSSLLRKGLRVNAITLESQFLMDNHVSLVKMLKAAFPNRRNYSTDAAQLLESKGIEVWFNEKEKLCIKDGTFIATLH